MKKWFLYITTTIVSIIIITSSALFVERLFFSDYHEPEPGEYEPLIPVHSTEVLSDEYDVIVVGTDPEGVAAAVSAARNGLHTLLIDSGDREILGGLMTLGWLNTIDMNTYTKRLSTRILNKGIFYEWYKQIEGDSFDIHTAANRFYEMVANEKQIDISLGNHSIQPILASDEMHDQRQVIGISVTDHSGLERTIAAKVVIDATQDADIAVRAGVPYTVNREDLGNAEAHMAVTAIFRLNGVTKEVWKAIEKRLETEDAGRKLYGANEMSAWGYNDVQHYEPVTTDRIRMRGLNIGRQNDESILINALQIFGVSGTDAAAKEEARQLAEQEIPYIIKYLQEQYEEFSGLTYGGLAPELYVRETRHIVGEYRLSMIDVLENRDQPDRIAFGSYPVDIQRVSPHDWGQVVSNPIAYAIPYRSIVPLHVDGLLVVGKAASFDTLPHGSARVIPVGMATGQAAGVAARIALEEQVSVREIAYSDALITRLQQLLSNQGVDLKQPHIPKLDYMLHEAYEGLKFVVSRGLWVGGYNNDFRLDEPMKMRTWRNLLVHLTKEREQLALWQQFFANFDGDSTITGEKIMEALKAISPEGERLLSPQTAALVSKQPELTNGALFMVLHDVMTASDERFYLMR